MTQTQRDISRKLRILNYAKAIGNGSKACWYFGIGRQAFYEWKKAFEQHGEKGLINKRPCSTNPALRTLTGIEEKVIYIRKTYHLGQQRIAWFLARYNGIKISPTGVWNFLKRNGMNRLPRNARKRPVQTKRYEKQVPGHHIQVDVKFLKIERSDGEKVKRFQYTAIDDTSRIRALKIYFSHTQENAIHFIDYVISKFPFRIHKVLTDNGHEFHAKFYRYI